MSDASLTRDSAIAAPVPAAVSDYVALLKPRPMSLVIFTGLVGMVLAPVSIHPVIAVAAMLCIAIGAGAAAAINMWYEADIDALMTRTRNRPIPRGRMAPGEALGFGVTLAIGSVVAMGLLVNIAAAALLALTILIYVFVYTIWLKRRTPQNIVIGGAAGALPPVIGWAAATGGIDWFPVLLFAIVFMWTPPHFWALALYRSDDYARAGVPMMPLVIGRAATCRQILIYTLALLPLAPLPWWLGYAGPLYGGAAIVLGLLFVLMALRLGQGDDEQAARHMFGFSILYLMLLFALLLVEKPLGIGA